MTEDRDQTIQKRTITRTNTEESKTEEGERGVQGVDRMRYGSIENV